MATVKTSTEAPPHDHEDDLEAPTTELLTKTLAQDPTVWTPSTTESEAACTVSAVPKKEAPPPELLTETPAQEPTVQAPSTATKREAASTAAAIPTPAVLIDNFELPKKKKKRRPVHNITFEGFDMAAVVDVDAFEEKVEGGEEEDEPTNSYEEKNPSIVGGEKRPLVVNVGAKKVIFSNFTNICISCQHQPEDVLNFLMSELQTSGRLDRNDQLIIKGKFQRQQIEVALRRYNTSTEDPPLELPKKKKKRRPCYTARE